MLKNKKVLMLLSLLISIALWLYVMGNVDPVIEANIYDIEITMNGESTLEDQGLEATLVKPQTINITISGKRSKVNKAKKETFTAVIDVSDGKVGENEAKIKVKKPDNVSGLTIESKSQETAEFFVEQQ